MTSVFEEKNSSRAILRVGLPAMLGQLTTLIYNIAYTCDYLKWIFAGLPWWAIVTEKTRKRGCAGS